MAEEAEERPFGNWQDSENDTGTDTDTDTDDNDNDNTDDTDDSDKSDEGADMGTSDDADSDSDDTGGSDADNDDDDNSGSDADEDDEPVLVSKDERKSISQSVKKANPDATEDELAKLVEDGVKSRQSEIDEETAETKLFQDKFAEAQKDPKNKGKSEEELATIARDLIDKTFDDADVFGNIAEDVVIPDVTEQDWTKVGAGLTVNGEKLEVEENSFQSFQDSIDAQVEKVKEEAEEYNQLGVTEKSLVKFVAREGIENLQHFINPSERIQKFQQLSDEDLVKSVLKQSQGKDTTDEELDDIVLDMQENVDKNGRSQYQKQVTALRSQLRTDIENARQEVLQRSENAELEKNTARDQRENDLAEKIIGEIDKLPDLAKGMAVPDKAKSKLKTMVSAAAIRKYQNDPSILAKLMLFDTFADDLIKGIRENSFNRGKNKGLQITRNIPPKAAIKGVNKGNTGAGADDQEKRPFASWAE